jgi:hypothetical protein
MQRPEAPRATPTAPCATPAARRVLQPPLSRVAPRACVVPARSPASRGLRGALRSCAPARELPPAPRRALLLMPRAAPRRASSRRVRAVEVRDASQP